MSFCFLLQHLVKVKRNFKQSLIELVTQFRFNGSVCPIPMRTNVSCPPICVTQLSDCPLSLSPSCPKDQIYCQDGTCRVSCTGVKSICSCSNGFVSLKISSTYGFYPCKTLKTDVINVCLLDCD